MSGERLTRGELSWLLAQEARGAAKSLRAEVGELRATLPPPREEDAERTSSLPMEKSLRALDDAISLLGKLENQGSDQPSKGRGRRGRIDLAALLLELAPDCRVEFEPGSGTEVVGDEQELRRMLLLLLNSHGGAGEIGRARDVQLRRQASWIRISVDLGPEMGPSSEVERRWLGRMAVKHGGKLELQGGRQSILLPAENSAQEEVEGLRRELFEAQQLGETYARELASMFTTAPASYTASSAAPVEPSDGATKPEHATPSSPLSRLASATDISAALTSSQQGVASALDTLRAITSAVAAGLSRSLNSDVKSDNSVHGLHAELAAIAAVRTGDPRRVDFRATVQAACERSNRRLEQRQEARSEQRHVLFETAGVEACSVRANPELLDLLARSSLEHALLASPPATTVRVELTVTQRECCFSTLDRGVILPDAVAQDVLHHRVAAGSVGRPASLALIVCQALVESLHGRIEFGSVQGAMVTRIYLPLTI